MAKRKEQPKVIEQQVQSYAYTRRVVVEEKTCPVCGTKFEGVKLRKFCSRPCQKKADYDRNAATYRALRMENYHRQRREAKKA